MGKVGTMYSASCLKPRRYSPFSTNSGAKITLLGAAQDGGVPSLGCSCPRCTYARSLGPAGFRDGWVSSLSVEEEGDGDSGGSYWLVDATPDIRSQVMLDSTVPLSGVLLTHAHMGHYAGLLQFGKEGMNVENLKVICTESMANFLSCNDPWSQLVANNNLNLLIIVPGKQEMQLGPQLWVSAVQVPHRSELSDCVGYIFRSTKGKGLLYVPDCDHWDWEVVSGRKFECWCREVDYAIIDGTFFSGDELPGRDMSTIPHPCVVSSIEKLKNRPCDITFTHMNHSNNMLLPESEEQKLVTSSGFRVGHFGMVWAI